MTEPMTFEGWGNQFRDSLRQAFTNLNAALQRQAAASAARRARRTPEQIDRASQARYKAAVAAERREGLAFVAREARRVRKELGLPCD